MWWCSLSLTKAEREFKHEILFSVSSFAAATLSHPHTLTISASLSIPQIANLSLIYGIFGK